VVPRAWANDASAGARWAWIRFRGSLRLDGCLVDSWLEGAGEEEFDGLEFVDGWLPIVAPL
jgi:hypothetical protein